MRRLVEGADVFVNNLLGRRQEKFGLDAASLLAVNPRLVHATMTGYGLDGPRRRPARLRHHRVLRPRRHHPLDHRAGQPGPAGPARRRATTPPRWR